MALTVATRAGRGGLAGAALAAAGLVAVGIVAVGIAAPVSRGATAGRVPTNILVFAREYALGASRQVVPAGLVRIQLRNIGQDDHDIAIRRRRAGATAVVSPIVHPGQTGALRVRLTPGRYLLWCTLPGHARLGMRATLTVVAARPRGPAGRRHPSP